MLTTHPRRTIGQPPRTSRQRSRSSTAAFTLVEMLVVITIIGILMGIAIPAINIGVRRARNTNIRLEITALDQAITKYQEKYGDYPPDFSSAAVVQRHYRKIFPRMSPNETALLSNMLFIAPGGAFDATACDRAEALAWVLGGYSSDVQRPFTGTGGPLEWVGTGSDSYASPATSGSLTANDQRQTVSNYQVNTDRPNSLMDFEQSRMDLTNVNPALAMTGANRRLSSDGDLFPIYRARDNGAPYLYFDSRTYATFDPTVPNVDGGMGDFNGYSTPAFGSARPLLSNNAVPNATGANYTSDAAALGGWKFVNPNTFQIISAGLDDNFGATASFDVDMDSASEAVYFQFPTGLAIAPQTNVATPGGLLIANVNKYQESVLGNTQQRPADNITNFTRGTIVDDLP